MLKNLFLILVIIFGLTNCSEDSSNDELLVGTSADYPPFEFKKNGEIIGFDIDLADEIGKKLKKEVRVVTFPFYRFKDALDQGIVDMVVAGITVTEERKKSVDFSDIYYFSNMAALFNRNYMKAESLDDFHNKVIGAQKGSTMESFLLDNSDLKASILSQEKVEDLVYDLQLGRIDGVFIDYEQAVEFSNLYKKELGYIKITESEGHGFAIAFRKGSELTSPVNHIIQNMKESKWLDKLKSKWMHIQTSEE